MTKLCQKYLAKLLSKFANSGGVQSGISEGLKEHISNLALSQFFGETQALVDKKFIKFAMRYVGIGGIFDSSCDTNSPVLHPIFAESQMKMHSEIQDIIERNKKGGFNVDNIDEADSRIKKNTILILLNLAENILTKSQLKVIIYLHLF